MCVSMPEMLALEGALSSATVKALAHQEATITIADGTTDYLLSSSSGHLGKAAKPANVSAQSCRIVAQSEVLKGAGTIDAAYLDAFKDVALYRKTNSWPLGPVSTDPDQVDVVAMHYGSYVVICDGR